MIDEEQFLDIVCVAAPRSGTTWLAEAMGQHPQIWVPPIKEVAFFNRPFLNQVEYKYPRGLRYLRKQYQNAPADVLLADLTPTYYVDPEVAYRIARHFPNAKILALLRNPADVIYSTYLKVREFKSVPGSLEEALLQMPELTDLGYYDRFLSPYYDWFDINHIYVGIYEEFFADTAASIQQVYRFLGVDSSFRPAILDRRVNPRRAVRFRSLVRAVEMAEWVANSRLGYPLKKLLSQTNRLAMLRQRVLLDFNLKPAPLPELDPETRGRLMARFERDMNHLERRLGRSLDHWRRPRARAPSPTASSG